MRYMLDTNICIYAIKNKPENVLTELMKHKPEDMCISSVTYAELSFGVEKSRQVLRNRIALDLFLSNIEILAFDTYAGDYYGQIRTDLERKGTPIGQLDMMIAAHAKSLGYTLVSNNINEFERIMDLKLENWAI